MKVLVLQSELGVLWGGGENFTRNLFAAFVERGHRVIAAFVADHRGNYQIPLPSGIEPVPIPGWWSRDLGQASISLVGKRLLFRKSFTPKWEYLQKALSWRAIKWHDRRFQRSIERRFKGM